MTRKRTARQTALLHAHQARINAEHDTRPLRERVLDKVVNTFILFVAIVVLLIGAGITRACEGGFMPLSVI